MIPGELCDVRRCACRETERRSWDADFKDTPSAQSTPALLWRLRVLRLAPVTSPVSGMPVCVTRLRDTELTGAEIIGVINARRD